MKDRYRKSRINYNARYVPNLFTRKIRNKIKFYNSSNTNILLGENLFENNTEVNDEDSKFNNIIYF